MSALVAFVNSFLSYLLLMAVIVIVAGVGIFIGITMRRKKNQKEAAESGKETEEAPVA